MLYLQTNREEIYLLKGIVRAITDVKESTINRWFLPTKQGLLKR